MAARGIPQLATSWCISYKDGDLLLDKQTYLVPRNATITTKKPNLLTHSATVTCHTPGVDRWSVTLPSTKVTTFATNIARELNARGFVNSCSRDSKCASEFTLWLLQIPAYSRGKWGVILINALLDWR